jgi:hypothetical protein
MLGARFEDRLTERQHHGFGDGYRCVPHYPTPLSFAKRYTCLASAVYLLGRLHSSGVLGKENDKEHVLFLTIPDLEMQSYP